MADDLTALPLHSAAWFGDSRDYWWNEDFLGLLARRWQLAEHHEVLDVGCGVGHWGRLLGRFLPADARIVGVDREPEWVRVAAERARGDRRFTYSQGVVEALPFDDNRFDLTTCQTVLMHLRDPAVALREMIRVTRPGGLIAVVEPNILATALVLDVGQRDEDPERILERLRFQLMCDRGRRSLGEGDLAVGDVLPSLFGTLGLQDLQIFLNDKAGALLPPYAGAEARANVKELEQLAERDHWIWSRAETLRYFVAGGGKEAAFEPSWQQALERQRRTATDVRRGTYAHAGGSVCYCISARKAA